MQGIEMEYIWLVIGMVLTIIIGLVSARRWYKNLKLFLLELSDMLEAIANFIDIVVGALEDDDISPEELAEIKLIAAQIKAEIMDMIPYIQNVMDVLRKWGNFQRTR